MTKCCCRFRVCICSHGWESFDENFKQTPELIISTITMCVKFTHVGLDFERIVEQFYQRQLETPDTFTYQLEYKQNKHLKNKTKMVTKTIKTTKRKQKNVKGQQQMYNSINLKSYIPRHFHDEELEEEELEEVADLVCCKLFKNGSCNITGFKNMNQIINYLHILINYLKTFKRDVFVYRDITEYTNVKEIQITLKKKKKVIIYKTVPRVRIDHLEGRVFRIELKTTEQEKLYIEDVYDFEIKDHDYEDIRYAKVSKENIAYFNAKISMVNATFKLPDYIFQSKVSDVLSQNKYSFYEGNGPITQAEFSLDNSYNAVKVGYVADSPTSSSSIESQDDITTTTTRKKIKKVSGEITISMFRTGSVTISGGTCGKPIISAYHFLSDIIRNQKDLSYIPESFDRAPNVKKKPKEKIRDIIKRMIITENV